MYQTGESWTKEAVVQVRNQSSNFLMSFRCFGPQHALLKSKMFEHDQAKYVVLGSSRVIEFRDIMFHPFEESFTNGGLMIADVPDLEEYVRYVESGVFHTPEVVILGMDHWWFRKWKRTLKSDLAPEALKEAVYNPRTHFPAMRIVGKAMIKGIFPWSRLLTGLPGNLGSGELITMGINAQVQGSGLRRDGSKQSIIGDYNLLYGTPGERDAIFLPIVEAAQSRTFRFQSNFEIDAVLFRRMVVALHSMQQMGVEIHTFIPPIADVVVDAFLEAGQTPDWWNDWHEGVPSRLIDENIPCLVFKSPREYGFDDMYMRDGVHPTEVFVSHILKELIINSSEDSKLREIDIEHLRALQNQEGVTPVAFEPPIIN